MPTGFLILATCNLDKLAAPKGDAAITPVFNVSAESLVVLGGSVRLQVSSQVDISRGIMTWISDDPTVATVDSVGRVRGLKAGSATITARLIAPELDTGLSQRRHVRVRYAAIRVLPVDSIEGLGLSRPVTVRGLDSAGLSQQTIASGVTLTSRDASKITINGMNVVGKAPGSARVVATFDGMADSIVVRLRQVAKRLVFPVTEYVIGARNVDRQLTATVFDVADSVIASPAITWTSRDTLIASVSASGLLRTRLVDTTRLTAVSDTVTRSIRVRVQQVPVSIVKELGDAQVDTVTRLLPVAPRVTVVDSGGIGIPDVNVAFTIESGGGLITGANARTDAQGRAALGSWRLSGIAGPHVVRATAGAATTTFTATARPFKPSRLAFDAQPTFVIEGDPITPGVSVSVRDSLDNVVTTASDSIQLDIAVNPGNAALLGTKKRESASGIATFADLKLTAGGSGYTLVASSGALNSAISNAFDVSGIPVKLGFVTQPSNGSRNAQISPAIRVAIQDANGNVASGASGEITLVFSTNPTGASLSGVLKANTVNGIATFSGISVNLDGIAYRLLASSPGLAAATSNAFDIVSPGTPRKLAYQVSPGTGTAGVALSPPIKVSVTDSVGVVASTYTGSVTLAIDPATNPGNAVPTGTLTAAVANGVATFDDVKVNKVGSYKWIASAASLTPVTSGTSTISAAAPAKLAFVTQPSAAQAGAVVSPAPVVAVLDAFDNVATNSAQRVITLNLENAAGAVLNGTLAVNTADGVATFPDLSVSAAGTNYVLSAVATGLINGLSQGFNITPATVATKLGFVPQPASGPVGNPIGFSIQLQDPSGTLVGNAPNVQVTVAIGSNPGGSILTGTAVKPTSNGSADFSFLLDKAGSGYTLTASAPGYPTATSTAFNLTASTATQLAFIQQPTATEAGQPINPVVRVAIQDANGNTVTNATNTVTLSIANSVAGATITGTTSVAAQNGIATFTGIRLRQAASYRFGASAVIAGGSTINGESQDFTVSPAGASVIAFASQPSATVVANAQLNASGVKVEVRDSLGNVVTVTPAPTISMALSGTAGGTLLGTLSAPATSGQASFSDLRVQKAGSGYRIHASATGFATINSDQFTIGPGPGTTLSFTTQPAAGATNFAITPQVSALDAYGNVASSDSRSITLAITAGTGTAGAVLTGTTTRAVASGVAAFTDLKIDKGGTYTLTATSPSLSNVVSQQFSLEWAGTTGLVGHYPMDGNLNDISGNGRHGTGAGSPVFSSGFTGAANGSLFLNGTSQYATLPAATTNAKTAGTLSMWIRMATISSFARCGRLELNGDVDGPWYCQYNLFAKTSDGSNRQFSAQLGGTPTDRFYFSLSGSEVEASSYTPAAAYTWGDWHLYTFTWDGTSKKVYLDGQLLATMASTQTTPASGDLHLGNNGINSHERLEGAIDDVRIYNRALSASEISALYSTPVTTWQTHNSGTTDRINSLWGSDSTTVWFTQNTTGAAGFVNKRNGASWPVQHDFGTVAYTLWGTSASEIFTIGWSSKMWRFNGTSWSIINSGDTYILADVWGSSGSNVFAVGSGGTIVRYNGTTPSLMTSNTTTSLSGVWGSGPNDVWAVGLNGTIMRYNGTTWSAVASPTTKQLVGIWGTSSTNVFAVGLDGTIIRWNGTSWSAMTSPTTNNLYRLWGRHEKEIYAVGAAGTLLRYNGTSWTKMTIPTTVELAAIWGPAIGRFYIAGHNGTLLQSP